MTRHADDSRDYRLTIGLLAGVVLGAGLGMWLGPRVASGARDQMTRAGGAAGRLVRKGRDMGDGLADAVARGAHEVERIAKSARSDARVQPS
jgi:hypothetical protein